jgi:hypothetical protein
MSKARFTTGVGRLVQGNVDEPQTKDAQGNPRLVKTGPNAGQPNPQFFIAVAFAKNEPVDPATGQQPFASLWGLLCQQAAQDFPNLFPQGPGGACIHPQFAFKVIDGDGVDSQGRAWSRLEGFAGHWIVRFASAYPPRCFYAGRYAAHEQIQEKGAIKRGYFVRVSGTVEGNGNVQRPGLYVNLDMVELAAYGPEIQSGPDAADAFGGGPAALPPGASATPLTPPMAAPAGAPAPGFPAPAAPGAPPYSVAASPVPGSPALPGVLALPAAPAAPPAPYTGYMGGAAGVAAYPTLPAPAGSPGAPAAGPAPLPTAYPGSPALPGAPALPPAPAAPAAPPPAAGPQMTAAAGGATYAQMIAAGWTDDTLRAHGMMVG